MNPMLDQDIREILFFQLESTADKLRIFEEKIIGSCRYDFLTVTDRLTGYEIKSDHDSYERLKKQIQYYDRYFDENYIVIGKRHEKSVFSKIPPYWGIYCVYEGSIEKMRDAEPNPRLQRCKQLELLWKRELHNILKTHHLPRYPQKSAKFIRQRLCEKLEDAVLLKEICNELMERDYTIFDE